MKYPSYILPILMLSACTDYSNAFECEPKPGLGCQSIREIHDQIIEHPTGDDALVVDEETVSCKDGKCVKSKASEITHPLLESREAYLVSMGNGWIHRVPERIIRIWVNGRVNEAGDYEAPHYVYVALKDDGWARVKHEGVINDDD